MLERTTKLIHNIITEHDNFLVVAHQNPDGDAVGSLSAMAGMLQSLGKKFQLFCVSPIPAQFHYIPYILETSQDTELFKQNWGAIIVCDSGDLKYAGIEPFLPKEKIYPLINIDHHRTNAGYGDYKLIIEQASSTTEVIYYYMVQNGIRITPDIATALLTGLFTDTTNFSNSGTSRKALSIASSLVKKGAHISLIRKNLLHDKRFETLKIWGIILNRLMHDEKTDMVYTYVTQEDMNIYHITEPELEGIANLMNNLSEGRATLVFRERNDNTIKISMRTTRDDIDVSHIAHAFGGGGHKKAAGFSVSGTMDSALREVLSTIEKMA
ncbi:MAG: bifunctional oligoribonuclease/PAP phosphatase NrnA [Candidatus Magasanikbacteria bacterium]|jgi:phosphoesterase RecJ-like protein